MKTDGCDFSRMDERLSLLVRIAIRARGESASIFAQRRASTSNALVGKLKELLALQFCSHEYVAF